jgi:hypothetical protein
MRRTLTALTLAASLAAAPPTLLDQVRAFLASLWSEEGCHLDPDGGCAAPRVDTGCRIDPNGRCSS